MNAQKMYELWNIIFGLKREVVGVKFLKTEDEFEKEKAQDILQSSRYCVLVKSAMSGKTIKVRCDKFKCMGSARTFGYIEVPKEYFSGEHYIKHGFHKNIDISKKVVKNMYLLDNESYGILLKPLNKFTSSNPDVILMTTIPYNAMRISQGYTYEYGLKKDFNIAGNQAVCLESTAVPYVENDINISMLCAGTRHAAKWDDTELMIGMAWDKAEKVLNGVIKTINTIEPDDKKEEIVSKNGSDEVNGEKIELGTAYFYKGTFR